MSILNKRLNLVFVISLFGMLSACGQSFDKKRDQSAMQFSTDKNYCRSEANGTWVGETGHSTVGIRSRRLGNQTYEDCMRTLGYQQSRPVPFK